jgi:MFS family permease
VTGSHRQWSDSHKAATQLRPLELTRGLLHGLRKKAHGHAGGAARLRVIFLFACVEALASADQGTVGAAAPQLEQSLHITNGEVGVIAAVAALAGAAGTVPVGVLTDRLQRIGLLTISIVLWSAAMAASAFAPSFAVLVATRVALGAVTATSGPTIASLTGDFFPARERARIWGLILTGELLGAGIGVVVSGDLAGAVSWRLGFGWLAIPGILLAVAIKRLLVEPARGGQSRLWPGATELISAKDVRRAGAEAPRRPRATESLERDQELAQEVVRRQEERPYPKLVLREDPVQMSLPTAVRYVLSVRTNAVLIVASALGYLFFAGVQTFAVLLLRSRYGLSQGVATALLVVVGLGALVGIVAAGRIADRLLRRGHVNARVVVGAVSYIAAAMIFIPGLASPVLAISMPLFVLGAAALAAPDPALNAARLDVMHPRLWGRAEGVRTVLRMVALAIGPLMFGFISGALGGPHSTSGSGGGVKHSSALAYTFLIMLVFVGISGLMMLRARRTYPRDVATAAESIAQTEKHSETGDGSRIDADVSAQGEPVAGRSRA